jgi:hypothetical protein
MFHLCIKKRRMTGFKIYGYFWAGGKSRKLAHNKYIIAMKNLRLLMKPRNFHQLFKKIKRSFKNLKRSGIRIITKCKHKAIHIIIFAQYLGFISAKKKINPAFLPYALIPLIHIYIYIYMHVFIRMYINIYVYIYVYESFSFKFQN